MISIPLFDDESLRWLDEAACAGRKINDYFVEAGHVISQDVLELCRRCPVRRNCLEVAYDQRFNITGGYFGGLSPGQRRELSLEQAVDFIATDLPSPIDLDDEPIAYT
jgi:hypothetical protein